MEREFFLNKAAHKPCSVSKQSSVWHWNYFQFLAISLKLANSLYSLHFNLAFSRGVPSRYFSISLVKLLTHRCIIACGISTHRQFTFLWSYPPVHTVRSFSGCLFLNVRTFLTRLRRDCSTALSLIMNLLEMYLL